MKRKLYIHSFFVIFFTLLWSSCDKMDRTYSEFLKDGQITYNAKLDSVKTYPGKNRILITWRPIADPRVTKVKILWANEQQSVEKPITSAQDTTLLIENLSEGNYTFNFYTYDDTGNHSMKVETLGLVYGEIYEKGLTPRQIKNIEFKDDALSITFHSAEQLNKYIGQEVSYISAIEQKEKTIFVPASETSVTIEDYSDEMFSQRSIYKPSELSPDSFYTPKTIQHTPSLPLLIYPENGSTGISCAPQFKWYNSVVIPDGTYKVEYSTDQNNWTNVAATDKETLIPWTILKPNTQYYWRVSTEKGGKKVTSEIQSFTTGEKNLHADGEAVRVLTHSSGLNPVRLVITGDGFQQSDYKYDGLFDNYVNEVVEAFFSVEPYKSYKEYFEVWKVAAYSDDSGISESDKSIRLNSVFESNFNGTALTCDTSTVYQYVKSVPETDDTSLSDMATIVILNKRRQGGYTYVSNNRRSVALVPIYRNYTTGVYTDLTNTVIRQGGGFAFGLLAEESSSLTGALSVSEEKKLKEAWESGLFLNVDLTNNSQQVRWAHFINRSGYTRPNIFEGGYGYKTGVFRCEEYSSMVNGIKYFNAIGRELIVKRISQIAGEEYSLEKFIEKDIARTPYQ